MSLVPTTRTAPIVSSLKSVQNPLESVQNPLKSVQNFSATKKSYIFEPYLLEKMSKSPKLLDFCLFRPEQTMISKKLLSNSRQTFLDKRG
jgi:hypothetical protein